MKKINLIKAFLLLSLFMLFNQSAAAQGENGVSLIKTADGFLIVNNDTANQSFMLEFKGEKLTPLETNTIAFNLDGKSVQLILAEQKNFITSDPKAQKPLTEKEILEAHKKWESDYINDALQTKVDVKSEFTTFGENRTALFWSYLMPEKLRADFTEQLYMTTVLGKIVLGLHIAVDKNSNANEIRSYMTKALSTLKVSQKPFDVKAISETIKQGKKP